ncbi:DUF317 domain-containing protein [Streptomyces zagrosensis]|uniref:DUF317 domain-containing protein n=1 Tax=Streptomyces zagrosensis TaxID=1042984 RepID=UPI0028AD68FC|nr:DUF317 domain-containing protein [Streptomyces zagrosensis]
MREWNAYFTGGVPSEALADLLVALGAREAPDTVVEGPERSWARSEPRAGSVTRTALAPPPWTPDSPATSA